MVSPDQLDWDDIRLFLAVFRSGSLRAASQVLGCSRPTTARRLDGLERRLGLALFDRRPDGLHATPAAAALGPRAEAVEEAVQGLTRAAMGADPELNGLVRVTVPAIVAAELLMDDFAAFCDRWPGIELAVSGSYGVENLSTQEADVAIRLMPSGVAPDSELHGRRVGNAWMAVYGRGDCWIGGRGDPHDRVWTERTPFKNLPIRGQMWDGTLQLAACRAGLGLARLPCFLADGRLERRSEPAPGLDIWVLVHPDLRRTPRLRLFRDMVVAAFQRQRERLKGLPTVPADR